MILSGILLTPTGVPYKNSSVRITANNTSEQVLMFVQKDFKTDVDGAYSIDVPNGWYHVSVFSLEYRSYVNIGNIEVTDLTTETTINALLMIGQTAGSDPLVAQVAADAASALASKNAAAVSATNAATSASSASVSATNAQNSSVASANSATASSTSATNSQASAVAAASSASSASTSAATATTKAAEAAASAQDALSSANEAEASAVYTESLLSTKENTITAGTSSQYWRGDKTFQTLDKSAVGLSNVNNTADIDKPVSLAQQALIDLKVNTTTLASASGSAGVGFTQTGTGFVVRAADSKLRERVSPYDFGALGNANFWNGTNWYADSGFTTLSNDDSSAISLAIGKLASQNGGVLDLCGGRFLTTSVHIVDKYITIENGTLVQCSLLIGPDNQVTDGFLGALQDWRDMFLTIQRVKFEFPFTVTTTSPNRHYDQRPSGNNPIQMQRSALVTINDCDFINCNACVSSVAKDVFQHVRQFTITNNRVNYCNYIWYGNYIDGGTNLLQHGDCNISDNIAIVCLISHIVFQGQDGWIVSGNTFFFPSYPFTYSLKKQNILAYKCAHGMISSNQMFEAGEEAILFNQCGRSSIVNNQIIWPGQRLESSGIRYTGGSLSADEYLLGTVAGNVIWDATKFGVEFESGEGHVTVTGNTIRGTGTITFYYGPAKVQLIGYAIYAATGSKKVNATGNTSDTPNYFAAVGGWYSSNIEAPDANVAFARTMSSKLTLNSTATTIDVTHYDTIALLQPSATTIANFVFSGNFSTLPSAQMDRELTLIAFNGNTTVANGTFVKLVGGVNRTIANNGTMKLRYYAGVWYEV